jgi:ketosteroid isomerase-like protein
MARKYQPGSPRSRNRLSTRRLLAFRASLPLVSPFGSTLYSPKPLSEVPLPLRAVFTVCTLVAAVFTLTPAGSSSSESQANAVITRVLYSQQVAWNQGDVVSFMDGYWKSSAVTFSGTDGISRGWDTVLARYKRSYSNKAAKGQLEFSGLEIRQLSEKSALVLGKWHLKRSSGDIGGVFTLVFQQFPEGWKIIHDHTSLVIPKNP